MDNEQQIELSEDVLTQDIENVNNIRSISKELFTGKNIPSKTELSSKQINAMARVRFTTRWLDNSINPDTKRPYTFEENFLEMVKDIQVLSASKSRKSREEFVRTMQIQNAQASRESFWGRLQGSGGAR